jgi:hypothetical protein
MKILSIIHGGWRDGQTWNKWVPRFRWTGVQFLFEYWNRSGFEMFDYEKDERRAYCVIVDPGKYDMNTVEKSIEACLNKDREIFVGAEAMFKGITFDEVAKDLGYIRISEVESILVPEVNCLHGSWGQGWNACVNKMKALLNEL